jgi:hypothetical protein
MMGPSGNECAAMIGQPLVFTECDLNADEDQMNDENQLKVEINTFVWSHAPDAMPLGKADEMACKIFELFIAARQEFANQ